MNHFFECLVNVHFIVCLTNEKRVLSEFVPLFQYLIRCYWFYFFQSISPGMVDTEFLTAFDSTFYANLPRLKPDDVTAAVVYALSTSEHTQVNIRWLIWNRNAVFNHFPLQKGKIKMKYFSSFSIPFELTTFSQIAGRGDRLTSHVQTLTEMKIERELFSLLFIVHGIKAGELHQFH